MINIIKRAIGRTMSPLSRSRRLADAGQGGGGDFAGTAEEWANPHVRGGILLGQSLHDPSWRVGLAPGRHLITVASSGAGKDRSRVNTVLLDFPGSVIVADVGGASAAVTAAARGNGGGRVRKGMGQDVYVLNGSGLHAGLPGMPPAAHFNPLAEIDINGPDVVERISAISEGLIRPTMQDRYWADGARDLWSALIGYVLTAPLDEKDGVRARTLTEARRLQTLRDGPPVTKMQNSEALRGMVAAKVAQIAAAEGKEKSGFRSTALGQTSFLDSHGFQDMFASSDFRLSDLWARPTTLYLAQRAGDVEAHGNFLRLIFNQAFDTASRIENPRVPVLFIMPEFYTLGRLDSVARSEANLRKHLVVMWPFVQNLGQIKELYQDNWETFIGNAHFEVFGVNDLTTARYAADLLGHTVVMRKGRDGAMHPAGVAPLRDPAELAFEVAPEGKRMIVFRGGPKPFLLKRLDYDAIYPKSRYNPDPYVGGS